MTKDDNKTLLWLHDNPHISDIATNCAKIMLKSLYETLKAIFPNINEDIIDFIVYCAKEELQSERSDKRSRQAPRSQA